MDKLANPSTERRGEIAAVLPNGATVTNIYEAYQAGLNEAIKICQELEQYWSDYKDTALLSGDVELSNAASGEPRAARAIAAAIRNSGSKGAA